MLVLKVKEKAIRAVVLSYNEVSYAVVIHPNFIVKSMYKRILVRVCYRFFSDECVTVDDMNVPCQYPL